MVVHSLYKICCNDNHSRETLSRYLRDYGNVVHDAIDTTLNNEIANS